MQRNLVRRNLGQFEREPPHWSGNQSGGTWNSPAKSTATFPSEKTPPQDWLPSSLGRTDT